jgi:hypothetical protein
MDRSEKIILIVFLVLLVVGLCIAITCGASLVFLGIIPGNQNEKAYGTVTPESISQTEIIPTPDATEESHTFRDSPEATLDSLRQTIIPDANWVQLAEQFNGLTGIPTHLTTPPVDYKIGDSLEFWVMNEDDNVSKKIVAILEYRTSDIYFLVEKLVDFNQTALKKAADTFAEKIYPTDQEFFGKEWIPGVDNDPHLYILYARGLGFNIAGYTSESDSFLQEAQKYSNEHEMFYINADSQSLSDPYTLGVMAHEFQHVIHGYHDPNEELWLNEGFSELATYINGYDPGGFDQEFARDPDINLTEWPKDPDATDIHYGASFLFTMYLLDRFGTDTTKAIVADPMNGLASIDDVFAKENLVDKTTNQVITSGELFQDWTLANYLNNTKIGDGRYGYRDFKAMPNFSESQSNENCSSRLQQGSVYQFGTDYIHISCDTKYTLTFTGNSTVNILSEYPTEGSHYMWSNMVDSSATRMTREFDFSNLSGAIDLTYDMYYDIEKDYDYAYLLASTDGETWKILPTPSCTYENPTGNNFGCGYNGSSDGWIHEDVNLSRFAGKKVYLRFEYITDEGITGEGLAIDDLAIPQLGYQTGFETDNGGWQLEGFTRIENQIPQNYLVSVIHGSGDQEAIDKYQLTDGKSLKIEIDPSVDGSDVTIVISGATKYTRQKAKYQFEITT